MTDSLTFDFDQVTPRMLVDFTEKTGADLMVLAANDALDLAAQRPEVIAGLIWLALRTSGKPETTWDEALDTPFTALEFAKAGEVDPYERRQRDVIAALCRHYPLTPGQVRDMPMGDIGLLLEAIGKASG